MKVCVSSSEHHQEGDWPEVRLQVCVVPWDPEDGPHAGGVGPQQWWQWWCDIRARRWKWGRGWEKPVPSLWPVLLFHHQFPATLLRAEPADQDGAKIGSPWRQFLCQPVRNKSWTLLPTTHATPSVDWDSPFLKAISAAGPVFPLPLLPAIKPRPHTEGVA